MRQSSVFYHKNENLTSPNTKQEWNDFTFRSSFILQTTPIPCHAHVSRLPGLVDVVHRACGGLRVVHRQWWSRPGRRAAYAAWRRWWHLLKPVSAARGPSTLDYSSPSPPSHYSTMVRLDRRGLIPWAPKAGGGDASPSQEIIGGRPPEIRVFKQLFSSHVCKNVVFSNIKKVAEIRGETKF